MVNSHIINTVSHGLRQIPIIRHEIEYLWENYYKLQSTEYKL